LRLTKKIHKEDFQGNFTTEVSSGKFTGEVSKGISKWRITSEIARES